MYIIFYSSHRVQGQMTYFFRGEKECLTPAACLRDGWMDGTMDGVSEREKYVNLWQSEKFLSFD
jgi:hypothetical protein